MGVSIGNRGASKSARWLFTSLLVLIALLGGNGKPGFSQGMGSSHHAASPVAPGSPPLVHTTISLEDIALEAGLNFKHESGEPLNKKFLLESIGSGVAIFDYDGDGLEDIFLVNATRWTNQGRAPKPTSKLYKNLGHLKFADVTESAGLTYSGWGQGTCTGDYDNDGREDLLVTYYGHNVLYHNDGNGRFTDVTAQVGLPTRGTVWGTGCTFFDYDRDGKLDIAIANYVDFDRKTVPLPGSNPICQFKGLPVICGPRGLNGSTNILYHNTGHGSFTDVSRAAGFDRPSGQYSFSVITGDFDGDGWPDVFIACDSTPNILLHNNQNGTFTNVAIESGVAFSDEGEEQANMGADAGDYNHTGRLDLVTTTFDDDVPGLFLNEGGNQFSDVYLQAGLGYRTHQVGWGVAFLDLDNRGWLDIFMANGHIYPNVDTLRRESHYRQERNLYYNLGNGKFADITEQSGPGTREKNIGRGLAYGDLLNNGSLDIVINNLDSTPNLLVNRGAKGNWITVKLVGTSSNRDAIGARVEVKAGSLDQMSEVRSGCCYLSQSDMRLHFGLGDVEAVESIKVRWPSGHTESFAVKGINQIVELTEGTGS
jgi:enediyne biosynthesis protein E4